MCVTITITLFSVWYVPYIDDKVTMVTRSKAGRKRDRNRKTEWLNGEDACLCTFTRVGFSLGPTTERQNTQI